MGLYISNHSNRLSYSIHSKGISNSCKRSLGRVSITLAAALACIILISAGITYRAFASKLGGGVISPVKLPLPLETFPAQIGDWSGSDQSIPATTRSYMEKNFADDYISRRYINDKAAAWADLYLVYCSSRPGAILGHRPGICYVGSGWVHDSTDESSFSTSQGKEIACLIHRFHKPEPNFGQIVVLNFYIVNGKIAVSEEGFTGTSWRSPNIAGDPARYVAQVQVSSTVENSTRLLAKEAADLILAYLPDENGNVAAISSDKNQADK